MGWSDRWRAAGLALALATAPGWPAAAAPGADPSWTQPQKPFHIVGNIYYVGSKGLAAYLIASPEGHILIDGTVAENAALIEDNIKSLGFQLHDVRILLSNHAHHDHAGALAQLKKDTGAELFAAPADVWALEHGRPRGDNAANQTSWPPAKVDHLLRDGEIVRLGPIALSTVFTPGHTPGCTSWAMDLVERDTKHGVFFLCSLTVAGNVLVGNKAYPGIVADYRKSLKRLEAYNGADVVLTGHPEVTDVIGRHEAELGGDPDAWSDSGQLIHILDAATAELDAALGKPHPPNAPAVAAPGGTRWRNVVRTDDHFAVQFPGAPAVTQVRYDLDGGATVPARSYSVREGRIVYRLTVADASGRAIDREAVFRKVLQRLRRGGQQRTLVEARIRNFYGRQISVELPGGGRSIASVFIAGPRLYELEARAEAPDGPSAVGDLLHFQQALNLF
jgi:metallo-beta-lactamase class B